MPPMTRARSWQSERTLRSSGCSGEKADRTPREQAPHVRMSQSILPRHALLRVLWARLFGGQRWRLEKPGCIICSFAPSRIATGERPGGSVSSSAEREFIWKSLSPCGPKEPGRTQAPASIRDARSETPRIPPLPPCDVLSSRSDRGQAKSNSRAGFSKFDGDIDRKLANRDRAKIP